MDKDDEDEHEDEAEDWEDYESTSGLLFARLSARTRFTVTEDHLKLLRRARANTWHPGEYDHGAVGIDLKRPYGNSYIEADVAEIVGAPDEDWVFEDGSKLHLTDEATERFLRLHIEAMAALQIVLAAGEFRPGPYRRSSFWTTDWQRDEDGR
jgi:hypothetical protein